MSLNTILFDFDGTLADTIPGIMATMAAITQNDGLEFSLTKARNLIGQPLAAMGNELVGPERSAEFVNCYFQEFPHHGAKMVRFFPGVESLIEELRGQGFTLGVVTSKRGSSLSHNLKVLRAENLFDLLVTNDKTLRHKPHPEPVEYAMNYLGKFPHECLMVGDTQYDLLAAEGAGVASVGVTWGVETAAQLKESRPTYIADSLAELRRIIYSLAPSQPF